MRKEILLITLTALGWLLSGTSYGAGEAGTEPAGSKVQGQGTNRLLPAVQKPAAANPGMGKPGEIPGGSSPVTGGPKGTGASSPITGGPKGTGASSPVTGGPKGGGVRTPGGAVMDKGDETAQKPAGHLPKKDAASGRAPESVGSKGQGTNALLPAVQKPSPSNPGIGKSGEAQRGSSPITGGPKGGGVKTPGSAVMDKSDETAQKPGGHLPKKDAASGRTQLSEDAGASDKHRGGPPKTSAQSKDSLGAARGGKVTAGPIDPTSGDPVAPPHK